MVSHRQQLASGNLYDKAIKKRHLLIPSDYAAFKKRVEKLAAIWRTDLDVLTLSEPFWETV